MKCSYHAWLEKAWQDYKLRVARQEQKLYGIEKSPVGGQRTGLRVTKRRQTIPQK